MGEICGDIEYVDPRFPRFTLCAPQLVFQGTEGDRDVFEEKPAYRAEACPAATLKLGHAGNGNSIFLDIEKYVAVGEPPCCHGIVRRTSTIPPGDEPVPNLPPLDGLTGPLIANALEYPTTPYPAADQFFAYFPIQGSVTAVSLTGGESPALAPNHDVASTLDPHAVAASGGTVWEARGPNNTVVRIKDLSGTPHAATIRLGHPPYALAADGDTLWITSLDDHMVLRVDSLSGEVLTSIPVAAPTGVVVGGGWVWVLDESRPALIRIDPTDGRPAKEIPLSDGTGTDSQPCDACAQSLIYAFGSVWTANNYARSITRVDSKSLALTMIPTRLRVWSVAAFGGSVYGSQFEENEGGYLQDEGGLVRISPKNNQADELSAPGVLGVAALGDYLWLIVPTRRSQYVLAYH